jgi:hypothetical protein
MNKLTIIFIICCCTLVQFSAINSETATPTRFVLHKMINELKACNSLAYTIRSYEKKASDNSVVKGESFTKLNIAPTKIYLKLINGSDAGTEILYVSG